MTILAPLKAPNTDGIDPGMILILPFLFSSLVLIALKLTHETKMVFLMVFRVLFKY